MKNINKNMPAILALFFAIIYAVINLFVIYHPDNQDDVISARAQDIMMLICGYYFVSSHRKKK